MSNISITTYALGDNLIADSNLGKVVEGADLLVFVTPHQFMEKLCQDMKGVAPSLGCSGTRRALLFVDREELFVG